MTSLSLLAGRLVACDKSTLVGKESMNSYQVDTYTWAVLENSAGCVCVGGGVLTTFLIICVFHRRPYEPPSRSKRGPIASLWGFVSVFLRKPIANVIFQGGGSGRPVTPPLWFLWIACFWTVTSTCGRGLICIPFCKNMTAKVGAYK